MSPAPKCFEVIYEETAAKQQNSDMPGKKMVEYRHTTQRSFDSLPHIAEVWIGETTT
jgi:hypothetical protein